MILVHRTALRRRAISKRPVWTPLTARAIHQSTTHLKEAAAKDPRVSPSGSPIAESNAETDFATLRDNYQAPKHPIILAHGLFGFDEIHPAGGMLGGVQYWSGIEEALAAKGVEVFTATVPPSGRIEVRAQRLAEEVERMVPERKVNIIAGLDARHMLSRLKPPNVSVLSLTTIATPHRGSAFADYIFSLVGTANIPKLYKTLEYFGLDTGAFRQLTQQYMLDKFNPRTPDVEGVRYFSYGAALRPQWTSVFRQSHDIIEKVEGENDGLVSVASSKWGTYKATLEDVSHLDLINWTNKLRWYLLLSLTGKQRNFNAIAFYLSVADMLAKEGL